MVLKIPFDFALDPILAHLEFNWLLNEVDNRWCPNLNRIVGREVVSRLRNRRETMTIAIAGGGIVRMPGWGCTLDRQWSLVWQ